MCDSTACYVLAPHLTAVFRSVSELCWPAACASSPPVSAGLPYPATRRLRQLGSSLRTCLHLKQEIAARMGININELRFTTLSWITFYAWVHRCRTWMEWPVGFMQKRKVSLKDGSRSWRHTLVFFLMILFWVATFTTYSFTYRSVKEHQQ